MPRGRGRSSCEDGLEELRRRGHDLRIVGPFRMPTAVGIDPRTGTLFGGADVRGERAIGGW